MGLRARREARWADREQTVRAVLEVDPERRWHVYGDLQPATRMGFGVLYATLARLEAAGVVESDWDEGYGKPRRRWYRARRQP